MHGMYNLNIRINSTQIIMNIILSALLGVLLSTCAYAGDILVEGAYTRATLPGQDMAMVYMSITSKQAAALVGVTTTAAKNAEMHNMEHKSGMMKMYEVKSISLQPNQRMEMGLHGYHLVLNGLKAPLAAGAHVPLTLTIETSDKHSVKLDVQAEVRPLKEAK